MTDDGPKVSDRDEKMHCSSAGKPDNEDLKLLRDAVRTLPPQPVKNLFSNGVCPRCIFRLFCLHEQIYCHPSITRPMLRAILCELTGYEGDASNNCSRETDSLNDLASDQELKEELKVCCVCLGILQFAYIDDKGMLVEKVCANDLAAAIGDIVKQEGHQIDGFSLEVSLPPLVVENEKAIWLYIEKKYCSEPWFQDKLPSGSIATKDFLKLSVTKPLERILDVKANGSSFRIRLTYTLSNASANNHQIKESNGCIKRRKTDVSGDFKKVEGHDPTRDSSVECENRGDSLLQFPLEKANPCSLMLQCYRMSIYIGGRYLKYSRNVSQTRWIIDDERMGESSIEEIVGANILPMCQGDTYKFHAAGREDIDVRMLGTGRPFLVEIQNARQCPSDVLVKEMEKKINSLERKLVKVKNLEILGNQVWELMREGEAEKQKQYAALVWISRPLDSEDVQTLSSLKDMQIVQKTPIRVLHRRSPLEREKTIHWMRVERIAGRSQYFLLHLCTQAGTYIKEFVHGDLGRTHPSIGSILKCRAEILQLDVTDVKMDCFQA